MSWVGLAVYAFACWMIGAIALRVAHRLGSLVEFTVAMIAIGVGGLGFPLLALPLTVELTDSTRAFAIGSAVVGFGAASMSLYFSTWRVHRPGSVLAALLCTAGTFAIAWSFLAIVFTQGYAWPRDRFWLTMQCVALWIPYPWTALELLSSARPLRRSGDEADRARGKSYLCYGIACASLTLAFIPGGAIAIQRRGVVYSPQLVAFLIATSGVTVTAAAIGFAGPLRQALRLRAGSAAAANEGVASA
jgi:hypothetical protein